MVHEETIDFGLAPGESFEPDDDDGEFEITWPHVMTVFGPIIPDGLGFTLHHEHILAHPAAGDDDLILDNPHRSMAELEIFGQSGGGAIVDVTTADYGRDIGSIVWIAERVPVHIVVATGYSQHRFAAPFVSHRSVADLADGLIRELTVGIEHTDVRAGVIKVGTSFGEITAIEQRIVQAAAQAHLETGVPISVDTDHGSMALELIAMLAAAGVHPANIIVARMDGQGDESHLHRVLDTGVFVSFDQISQMEFGSDKNRTGVIARLVDGGFIDQLLLSSNLNRKSLRLAYGGTLGWTFLIDTVPLLLMEAGLSAASVRQLFFDNPARALTVDPDVNRGHQI